MHEQQAKALSVSNDTSIAAAGFLSITRSTSTTEADDVTRPKSRSAAEWLQLEVQLAHRMGFTHEQFRTDYFPTDDMRKAALQTVSSALDSGKLDDSVLSEGTPEHWAAERAKSQAELVSAALESVHGLPYDSVCVCVCVCVCVSWNVSALGCWAGRGSGQHSKCRL